jgi:hypothetical protein
MRGWLREADRIAAELPRVRLILWQIEARALPAAGEVSRQQFRAHLKKVAVLQQAIDRSHDSVDGPDPQLIADPADARPAALDARAWPLVDPDRPAASYGDEARGLALARRAVALPGDGRLRVYQRTQAWALFANGLFDEARAALAAALRLAPAEEAGAYRLVQRRLDQAVVDAPRALAQAWAELAARHGELSPPRAGAPSVAAADRELHGDLAAIAAGIEAFAGPLSRKTTPQKLALLRRLGANRILICRYAKLDDQSGDRALQRFDAFLRASSSCNGQHSQVFQCLELLQPAVGNPRAAQIQLDQAAYG